VIHARGAAWIPCRKPIDENSEQYVVTNKDTAKNRIDWLYAHALTNFEDITPEQVSEHRFFERADFRRKV
jgi:hypothetical protein